MAKLDNEIEKLYYRLIEENPKGKESAVAVAKVRQGVEKTKNYMVDNVVKLQPEIMHDLLLWIIWAFLKGLDRESQIHLLKAYLVMLKKFEYERGVNLLRHLTAKKWVEIWKRRWKKM